MQELFTEQRPSKTEAKERGKRVRRERRERGDR